MHPEISNAAECAENESFEEHEAQSPESHSPDNWHPSREIRKIAAEGILKQADKMMGRTKKKLIEPKIGDCVTVPISQYDRSKVDPPNLIGVVIDIKNSKYQVGTRGGIINYWFERNAFEVIKYKPLKKEDVPDKFNSIREIVREVSVGHGQGYQKCNCRGNCNNKKCKCFQNNFKCNSSCHTKSKICLNHD